MTAGKYADALNDLGDAAASAGKAAGKDSLQSAQALTALGRIEYLTGHLQKRNPLPTFPQGAGL